MRENLLQQREVFLRAEQAYLARVDERANQLRLLDSAVDRARERLSEEHKTLCELVGQEAEELKALLQSASAAEEARAAAAVGRDLAAPEPGDVASGVFDVQLLPVESANIFAYGGKAAEEMLMRLERDAPHPAWPPGADPTSPAVNDDPRPTTNPAD